MVSMLCMLLGITKWAPHFSAAAQKWYFQQKAKGAFLRGREAKSGKRGLLTRHLGDKVCYLPTQDRCCYATKTALCKKDPRRPNQSIHTWICHKVLCYSTVFVCPCYCCELNLTVTTCHACVYDDGFYLVVYRVSLFQNGWLGCDKGEDERAFPPP